ncbi:MAG TPA: efflux RND transporter periplasmic adaptor subunit [Dysgonomonas sp.]|nr:efflux RND transporter periplasmic adaptor subunit [Dysgonomonas sp.]
MCMKKTSLTILSVILLASCGNNNNNEQKVQQPDVYPTEVISRRDATLETTFPVTIRGTEDVEIKPRIDGWIVDVYVDEGAVVRKGQSLFRIDSPIAQQAVTTAEAAVNSAQAQVNTAQTNVDRMTPLAEREIISEVQIRTLRNVLDQARAALQQSEAQLKNARAQLSWTDVTSPVNGVVGKINLRQGNLVNSAVVLTTVSSIGNVFANFSLNEKALMDLLGTLEGNTQAEKIKNIPEVTLTLNGGMVYPEKGKVETISGVVDINTGSVNMRAVFPNPNGILKSGASGTITIPRTVENVFVIPQKATFQQQDKVLVYKVQGDSVVNTIISVLPMPGGKEYAVTTGLSDGDRIVTDNLISLSNGRKIRVQ